MPEPNITLLGHYINRVLLEFETGPGSNDGLRRSIYQLLTTLFVEESVIDVRLLALHKLQQFYQEMEGNPNSEVVESCLHSVF